MSRPRVTFLIENNENKQTKKHCTISYTFRSHDSLFTNLIGNSFIKTIKKNIRASLGATVSHGTKPGKVYVLYMRVLALAAELGDSVLIYLSSIDKISVVIHGFCGLELLPLDLSLYFFRCIFFRCKPTRSL